MRRPLGGGMPLLLSNGAPGAPLTVFDTNDFDVPGSVSRPGTGGLLFELTLFVWPLDGAGFTPTFSDLEVTLVSSGVPVVLLDIPAAALDTLFATNFVLGESIKILEKLVLRGDQQVILQGDGASDLAVYGYFESGEQPLPFGVRPLEPAPLAAPFDAAPATIVVPGGGVTALAPAHLLEVNGNYWDYVTLFVSAGLDIVEGVDDTGHASVQLPNGMNLFVPSIPVNGAGGLAPVRIFDGIPLQAPTQNNNLIQIGATPGAAGAGITTLVSTGRFVRGT